MTQIVFVLKAKEGSKTQSNSAIIENPKIITPLEH